MVALQTGHDPDVSSGPSDIRGGRFQGRKVLIDLGWGLGSIGLAAVVYQLSIVVGILPTRYFPSVPELASTLVQLLGQNVYWLAVWDTVRDTSTGLLVATCIAIPVGIALGIDRRVYTLTRFPIEFLRPIPAVAVIPLFVLVSGSGSQTKVLLAAFSAVFPILLQTIYGVRDVDPQGLQTARSFRISLRRQIVHVIVPSATPFILTGLRIATSVAILVAISTEIIVGAPGVGQAISVAQRAGREAEMYAFVITAGLLGVLANSVLGYFEKRTARSRRRSAEV
jgi:ABC-type nitrate/sulfonate/bicarbonate transport system permease component